MLNLQRTHRLRTLPSGSKILDINITRTDVMSEAFMFCFEETPDQQLYREQNITGVKNLDPEYADIIEYLKEDPITEEEFNENYANQGIEYDPNMTRRGAEYLIDFKKRRAVRHYIMSRGKGDTLEEITKFGAGLLGSMVSPINIGSSFIPIGGEAVCVNVNVKCTTNVNEKCTSQKSLNIGKKQLT